MNFLKTQKDENMLQNRPHIPPNLRIVYEFMKKYQE
jgi:hypothetical protein